MDASSDARRRPERPPRSGARGAALSPQFLSTVAISFLFILGVAIVVPVLPLVADEYAVSRAGAGMLLSSFAFGRLAFDLVAGALGDRFGIRRVAVVACLVTFTASLYAATVPDYGWLLAARFAQGAGSALYMTVAMGQVIAIAPRDHVGRLLAIYQGVILAGVSLGPAVGGMIAGAGGIAGPFLLYAAFGLVGFVLALWILPARGPRPVTAADEVPVPRWPLLRDLLANRSFQVVCVGAFAVFAVRAGIGNTLIPLFAAERFGFSEAAIGLLVTVGAFGNLAVLAHAGRSVDRSGRRAVLTRSMAVMAPLVAAMALVFSPWALFVAAALVGAVKGYAGVVPGAVLSDLADERVRGTAVGVQRTMTDLGLLAGPVAAGGLADGLGYSGAFLAVGVVVFAMALFSRVMAETSARPAEVAVAGAASGAEAPGVEESPAATRAPAG